MAVVTGGTNGIGRAVVLRLLQQRRMHVLLVGRSVDKGQAALHELRLAVPGAVVEFVPADLSLMQEVERLASFLLERYPRLDVLVHSAGVMLPGRTLTAEGLETVFAVQYLARFWLTQTLIPCFTDQTRIVSISAGGTLPIRLDFENLNGEKFYHGIYALMHESVANDLFALRFNRCYPEICYLSYGPFYVKSSLFAQMPWWFQALINTFGRVVATTPDHAADDVARLLTGEYASGFYSRNLKPVVPSRDRLAEAQQDRLWQISRELVAKATRPQG